MSLNIRVLRALHSRQFALLWSGQTISSLGDGAFATALAWEVLLLTKSSAAMGLVVTAEIVPRLLFLLLGGVAADRLPRRLVMLWSDAGRAIVILLIAVLGWLHLLQLWHLVVLSLLFGVAAGFFLPAYRSIPPQLVQLEVLPSANALTGLSQKMSILLGPLLGAGLVVLAGPISAFAFDGLTFIASAFCLLAMRFPSAITSVTRKKRATSEIGQVDTKSIVAPAKPSVRQSLRRVRDDLREGWRFVLSAKWFWMGLPIATLSNIFFSGPLNVALPKLVHDVYGTGVWLLGAIGTATAIGSIAAAFLVGQVSRMPKRGMIMYLAVLLAGVAEGVLGLPFPGTSAPVFACIANGLLGFGLGAFGIIWVTVMQELVPADKLGRVSSIDQLGAWSFLPLGYELTGIATDHIGPSMVFLIGGIANVLLALIALAVPDIRKLK